MTGCTTVAPGEVAPVSQVMFFEDAERFSALMANDGLPDAAMLQAAYIDPGSRGVEIFTPGRIQSADNLARRIAEKPDAYRHAIEVCLPIVRDLQVSVSETLAAVSGALGMKDLEREGDYPDTVPAYFVFGAGNSGGTATADALVIGLEVVCAGKDASNARLALEEFVAHEVTHSYQQQVRAPGAGGSLLEMVLTEGMADFMMELVLSGPNLSDADRAAYGLVHEARLWSELKADIDSGVPGRGDWMYGPGRDGRVADLGYWIGKRICQTYYEKASDKTAALQNLLLLEDPEAILAESGYGTQFDASP